MTESKALPNTMAAVQSKAEKGGDSKDGHGHDEEASHGHKISDNPTLNLSETFTIVC